MGANKYLVRKFMKRIHRLCKCTAARAQASPVGRFCNSFTRFTLGPCLLLASSVVANAQFKVVGPAPLSPTAARQQIRTLLSQVDPNNTRQTTAKLSSLLAWYRDIVDEELIAAWQKDSRANLPDVMESLATSRVASAMVDFSWRQQREATFDLAYAPMFGHLMTRFPESAQPLLDDLLDSGKPPPHLSDPVAKAVCRIMLDMPEIGMWRQNALAILPHYRQVAESLLVQDSRGSEEEKSFQARRWLADLRWDVSGIGNEQPSLGRRPVRSRTPVASQRRYGDRAGPLLMPPAEADQAPMPPLPAQPPIQRTSVAPAPLPEVAPRSPVASAPAPSSPPYAGPQSGTLESSGGPIPQNAEYVFRNLPPVKLLLDYDTKIWDARLAPGEGQTQRLILKNKSSGPQKRCVVHWDVMP